MITTMIIKKIDNLKFLRQIVANYSKFKSIITQI